MNIGIANTNCRSRSKSGRTRDGAPTDPVVGAASSRDIVAPRMVLLRLGIMKKTIAFAVFFTMLIFNGNIFALPRRMADPEGGIEVEKEWKGNHCGYTEPERLVVKTKDQWGEVWGKMHRLRLSTPELPVIDFKKEMVIAVFMGERKTGGYEIEIKKIVERENEIIVEVEERGPPPESLQTMALTQPYHLIVIPKSSLPVTFQSI
jgi:hypothetical protein